MRKISFLMIFFFGLSLVFAETKEKKRDKYLEIQSNLTTFHEVYKKVTSSYVDEINPDQFLKAGIEGMLKTLDPYTVLFEKGNTKELDILKFNKYSGIGIQVGMEEEEITIFTVMENSPASRSGLLVGDKIIEINGNSLKNKNANDIQEYLLLPVGSEVILKIKRFDEEEPLDYTLTTEEILVKNIPYFGFVGEGVGYIKLSKFTRNSGYDVKEAIISLKTNELNGLILDLRGNPGGLLDEAIEVLSNFLPQNELVVYTQNEKDEVKSKYFTKNTPVYLEKPLIVLVDEGSASASEIVAGAIQDLDRGIILGEATF
ncbi:PDZ domain-containing protein, partial [bacterium]|nr:PDZ domain-containing protein [bacterium]